jgi:hypothetical protein
VLTMTEVPHIFERWYRVDKARTRATGGSGPGLSIVQAIVERHNGTVSVESLLGQGSVFQVRLPEAFKMGEAPLCENVSRDHLMGKVGISRQHVFREDKKLPPSRHSR